MKEYTYSDARQHLATLLEEATREGVVRIRRRDGTVFSIRPAEPSSSPLDVPAVKLRLRRGEVLQLVREGRRPA